MQLIRSLAALAVIIPGVAFASPALAGICILTLDTGGSLGLSSDGARLGSQEGSGHFALVAVASVGASTVTVAAPTITQSPAGFSAAGSTAEVAYQGAGVLTGVSQGYASAQTSFGVPNLVGTVLLTLNNRIRTTAGLPAGNYTTRTVVTCS